MKNVAIAIFALLIFALPVGLTYSWVRGAAEANSCALHWLCRRVRCDV